MNSSITNKFDSINHSLLAQEIANLMKHNALLTRHEGVICNGCQSSPIIGIRYKCDGCMHYDLCSSCASKNVHHETGHSFWMIQSASQLVKLESKNKSNPCFGDSFQNNNKSINNNNNNSKPFTCPAFYNPNPDSSYDNHHNNNNNNNNNNNKHHQFMQPGGFSNGSQNSLDPFQRSSNNTDTSKLLYAPGFLTPNANVSQPSFDFTFKGNQNNSNNNSFEAALDFSNMN